MNGIALNRIPGLQAAIQKARAKQEQARELAWKGLPRDILGIQARIMTVRDYVVLDHYQSPFLNRQLPKMEDLAFFFWVLSPECEKWNNKKSQFGRRISAYLYSRKVCKRFAADIPEDHKGKVCFQEAIHLAFAYIGDMFLDAPPTVRNGAESGVHYLTSWFDLIQSEHGLSEESIWNMPLPQLFQRVMVIRQRKSNGEMPCFNRAEDDLKSFIVRGLQTNQFTYDDLANGRVKFGDN